MTRRARRWARPLGGVAAVVGCAFLVAPHGGPSAGAADHTGHADPVPMLGAVVLPTVAPGYLVASHGPLDIPPFASDAPDPTAAARALSTLGGPISTYERVWHADGGRNQVQDLLVRFADPVRAQVFLQAAQRSLETGEIVSSDPLRSIPGARRVTYFPATDHDGVGQAITMRAGVYVDLPYLSAAGNAHPISPANADRLAEAQQAAMAGAPGDATTTTPATDSKKGASAGTIGEAVVVVAIAAAAVAAPGLLRRRRLAQEAAASRASAGDAVDDLSEHRG